MRRHHLSFFTSLLLTTFFIKAQGLPPEVTAELTRASIKSEAIAVWVAEAEQPTRIRLDHRGNAPMNPASVMKLVTTYAALDILGPTFQWQTKIYLNGAIRDRTLKGNLIIVGQGDPSLVTERLWLLLKKVRDMGVDNVSGDITIDNSAFADVAKDPSQFDGEHFRPYNTSPEAFLVNFKSLVLTFLPMPDGTARVLPNPILSGVVLPHTVPLSYGPCFDYRAKLKADFSNPNVLRLNGTFPLSCGERTWSIAYPEPRTFSQRAVLGMWESLGGSLSGKVLIQPFKPTPGLGSFTYNSPPLPEVIRNINKFSNNVMAQQLFLTLPHHLNRTPSTVTFNQAQKTINEWWSNRISPHGQPRVDNGSGLSRDARISAKALGEMLGVAYHSPHMSELMSSLPILGIDGTLKKFSPHSKGSAHLKSGSLRGVQALAGYVTAKSGRRYIFVAIVNDERAAQGQMTLNALLSWTINDGRAPEN